MGVVLGLSAGLSPGPLLTLVISETLQHGVKAGVRVAFVPMITDLPIIALTLLLLARLTYFQEILGMITIAGSLFVLSLGYAGVRTRGLDLQVREPVAQSLTKGILANLLNPHPYLFWLSVGAPTITRAATRDLASPVLFLVGFYVLLVGSKVALALAVGRSRRLIVGKPYLYTMRLLGLLLMALALLLLHEGLILLGVVGESG